MERASRHLRLSSSPKTVRRQCKDRLRTWAGSWHRAFRATLAACAIEAQDIEYEVEMQRRQRTRTLHFHFNCYQDLGGGG